LASCLVSALGGCMHAQPSRPVTVTIDKGYEGVYLDVLKSARRCYPATTGSAQREVEGTLDATAWTCPASADGLISKFQRSP
jgi:hypothetical protein